MAKQLHKPPAQSEKDRLGCIGGLVSMFGFRQVQSPQKLLQDIRHIYSSHGGTGYRRNKLDKGNHWERKSEVIFDVDEKKAGAVTTSIKSLMEEEMSMAHPGEKYVSPEVGRIKSGLDYGTNVDEIHKRISQNYKIAFDHHANDFRVSVDAKSCQNKCAYQFETPNISLNMPGLMVEVSHQCQENPVDLKNKIEPFSACKADRRKDNLLVNFAAQLTDKNCILQKAQCDVTEAFPNQKSLDTELFSSNKRIQFSEEVMDSLELLNVNKELLLELLEDQDPLLLKHVHEFQDIQAGKCSELELCENMEGSDMLGEKDCCIRQYEELASHKLIHMPNNSFPRKDESKGIRRLKGHDPYLDIERIVVLKPNIARNQNSSISFKPDNQSQSEYSRKHDEGLDRVAFHFSLTEIKRKLRHAVSDRKRERLLISMDDVLHRIPHETAKSGIIDKSSEVENFRREFLSKTTSTGEHTTRTSVKREDKRGKLTEWASNMGSGSAWKFYGNKKLNAAGGADPPYRESILYDETKKHLTIMLDSERRNGKMCAKKAPKALRRLFSWSEYNLLSPISSPGRDEDLESPQNMLPSPRRKFMQETTANHMRLKQNIKGSQHMDAKQDHGIQVVHSHKKSESGEAIETVDIICMEERDCLAEHSEINSTEICFQSVRCNEEQLNSSLLVLDADEGRPQPLTSCISVLPKSMCAPKLEVPQALMETPERPSPVSVLEAFFSDDVDSPVSTTTGKSNKSPVHPGQTHFEEHENSLEPLSYFNTNAGTSGEENDARFRYVQTLVQASGMSYDKLSKIWKFSDTLMDPFLFDEVAVSLSHLPDDPKLLFDCTNEVLVQVSHRCFKCTPWLYTIKPDIRPAPVGRSLIQEVCKGINRHIHWQFVYSLDQTVRKDMDSGAWTKLQCEIERTVFNIGDAILADLVEETVLYLWAQFHSKNNVAP